MLDNESTGINVRYTTVLYIYLFLIDWLIDWLIAKKTDNESMLSNKYFALIGQFYIKCTKTIMENFITGSPDHHIY